MDVFISSTFTAYLLWILHCASFVYAQYMYIETLCFIEQCCCSKHSRGHDLWLGAERVSDPLAVHAWQQHEQPKRSRIYIQDSSICCFFLWYKLRFSTFYWHGKGWTLTDLSLCIHRTHTVTLRRWFTLWNIHLHSLLISWKKWCKNKFEFFY